MEHVEKVLKLLPELSHHLEGWDMALEQWKPIESVCMGMNVAMMCKEDGRLSDVWVSSVLSDRMFELFRDVLRDLKPRAFLEDECMAHIQKGIPDCPDCKAKWSAVPAETKSLSRDALITGFLKYVHENSYADTVMHDWAKADKIITAHIEKVCLEMKDFAGVDESYDAASDCWRQICNVCIGFRFDLVRNDDQLKYCDKEIDMEGMFVKLIRELRPKAFQDSKELPVVSVFADAKTLQHLAEGSTHFTKCKGQQAQEKILLCMSALAGKVVPKTREELHSMLSKASLGTVEMVLNIAAACLADIYKIEV